MPDEPLHFDHVWIWGLPLARVTFEQTVDMVDRLIEQGQPGFFITANLHYAMLTRRDPRLPGVNDQAAFIVADGAPMVCYSRLTRRGLPGRVTGSDLIYLLCRRAAQRRHRVFLLGGAPGIAGRAAQQLFRLYPELQIAGIEAPIMDELSGQQQRALIARIRRARPGLLFAALGQPKGELWLAQHREALGVPVSVQVGASFDFVAGKVQRAPKWIQRMGVEWLYRLSREPKRMAPRYWADARFLVAAVLRDVLSVFRHKRR